MQKPFRSYRRIVVLTGAGISVASGLRPYRGPGGLWNDLDVQEYGHTTNLASQPQKVWKQYGAMRAVAQDAVPNAAHRALADFERTLDDDQSFLLITQNVDGLHGRAGSTRLAELHGSLLRSRCNDPACDLPPFVDHASHADTLPTCPRCGGLVRPDIVFFGEAVMLDASWASKRALRDCDLFVAIGTSGSVTPAADFVRSADYVGARTAYVNVEPNPASARPFHEQHLGKAEELLPGLFA